MRLVDKCIPSAEAFIDLQCRKQSDAPSLADSRSPGELHPEVFDRVRTLGLGRNVSELHGLGYTVVPDFGEELTRQVRAAILRSASPADVELGQDMAWITAVTDPRILALSEAIVGRGALLSGLNAAVTRPGDRGVALACDQSWWPDPLPEHTQLVTFCLITDDSFTSIEGGPIGVAPRSHKLRRHPTAAEADAEAGLRAIRAPAGSLAIWRGETWHTRFPRLRGGEGVVALFSYARLCCRPRDDFSAYANEAWLRGTPAALRTLLGMSDMLGKPRRQAIAWRRATLEVARG